jgi:hypothetical protein
VHESTVVCPTRSATAWLAVNVPARVVSSAIVPSAAPASPDSESDAVQPADAGDPTVTGAGQLSAPAGGDLSIEIGPDVAVVTCPTRSAQSAERSCPAPSSPTTTGAGAAPARPAPTSEHANVTVTDAFVQLPGW